MVLKNTKWNFVLMGLIYGGTMGLVFATQNSNYTLGLTMGGVAGFVFGFIMYLVNARLEKKAQVLFQQVGCMRKVFCQGAATWRMNPLNGVAGWMFLTEAALEFYPHKANIGGKNVPILLSDILSTEVRGNNLIVKTAAKNYSFQVVKAQEWKKQIQNAIAVVNIREVFN